MKFIFLNLIKSNLANFVFYFQIFYKVYILFENYFRKICENHFRIIFINYFRNYFRNYFQIFCKSSCFILNNLREICEY